MSAPRKITTARRIGSGRRDILTAETTMSMGYVDANTYHHDDVVRELVEALTVCRNWIDDEAAQPDTRGFDSLMELINAALAKIAQEG